MLRQLLLVCQNWHQGVTWDAILVCFPAHLPAHPLLRLTESPSPAGAPRPRPPWGEAPLRSPIAFVGTVTACRTGGVIGGPHAKWKCWDPLKVIKNFKMQEEQGGAMGAAAATKAVEPALKRTHITLS